MKIELKMEQYPKIRRNMVIVVETLNIIVLGGFLHEARFYLRDK